MSLAGYFTSLWIVITAPAGWKLRLRRLPDCRRPQPLHIPETGLYRLCRKNVLSGVSFRVALYPTTKPVWMR
jgi:hypothetical protein